MKYPEFVTNFKEIIGGATQKEVAKKTSINPATISKLLGGTKDPNIDILVKISKAYNCSIDYLLGFQEKHKEKNEYTYSDFLKMLHFLVNANCVTIDKADFDAMYPEESGYTTKVRNAQQTFYFNDGKLERLVKDYGDTLNYIEERGDKEMGKKLFNAWYELELEKGNDTIIHSDHSNDDLLHLPDSISDDLPFD